SWRKPSTTDGVDGSERVVVTHPFHPLTGQKFELVGYAHTWGEHRVFFRKSGEERVYSIPVPWTDVEGVDPFVVISAGRAHFRVEDLLALAGVLCQCKEGKA
ncbi:MAG TPA: DUF5372 family protein, partial [Candidatus Dormibacteraeota bacterium]|nr:DUF5372 family protein [Candidatus Dormibacteraeota bacterium]